MIFDFNATDMYGDHEFYFNIPASVTGRHSNRTNGDFSQQYEATEDI